MMKGLGWTWGGVRASEPRFSGSVRGEGMKCLKVDHEKQLICDSHCSP